MRLSEVSKKYAKALYLQAKQNNSEIKTFEQLRVLATAFNSDASFAEFFNSPLLTSELKFKAISAAVDGRGLTPEILGLFKVLADKDRLGVFADVVESYQESVDADNGITRGYVKSASVLDAESRQKLEANITKSIGKKVILNYSEDSSLIGGLVTEVGGWTFDDSIKSHIKNMNEELKRRAN